MPTDKSTVRVAFLGDASKLAQEAKRASQSVDSVGDSARRMGEKLGRSFAIGAAGAATAAAALARNAINSASDLNESLSKSQAVFGSSAESVRKWANDSSKNILLTRQAAIEGAATFGNLFTALGINQGAAAGLSTKLVGLASDLSSFNNVGTDEALLALRSGLLGEAEPLRKFGVTLSQARIEAEAFSLGLAKPVKNAAAITSAQIKVAAATANLTKVQKEHGKGTLAAAQAQDALDRANAGLTKAMAGQKVELTAAQKAQAAYSIILKDTKTAQGDAARTSDGYANKTRILRKQLSDMSAELGMKLLPYASRAASYMSKLVTEFQNGTGDGGRLRDVLSSAGDAAKKLGDVLIPIVRFLAEHPRVFYTLAGGVAAFKVAAGLAAFKASALGTAIFGVRDAEVAATAVAPAAEGAMTGVAGAATTALGQIGLALAAAYAAYKLYDEIVKRLNNPDSVRNANAGTPSATIDLPPQKPVIDFNGKKYWADGSGEVGTKPGEPGFIGPTKPKTFADTKPDDYDQKAGRGKSYVQTTKASADAAATAKKQADATKQAADVTGAAQKYAADQAEAAAKRKADAADALQKASDKMRQALEDRQNTAKGIRDSLIGSNSVVRDGLSWTAKDLLSRFRTQMDKVRRFSAAIQEMVRKGYSPSIVRQVADAGVQGGFGTAIGLAHASSQQVRQFNAVQGGIERAAGYAGNSVASQMGPIQIVTKVMLNDREIATAVNNYNRQLAATGHR